MNIPTLQQVPPGMSPQVISSQSVVPTTQQQQNLNLSGQSQEKLDNISKVKSLIGQLRESLSVTLKSAAHTLHQNSLVDTGSSKGVDVQPARFDKSLEEFYSVCDQIELHLKTSIECLNQNASSQRYLSLPVYPARSEISNQDPATLTYPQYLATVKSQVSYAKEVHDMLVLASQNIAQNE